MAVLGKTYDPANHLHNLLQLTRIDQPNGWRLVSLIAILSHLMVWSGWRYQDNKEHRHEPHFRSRSNPTGDRNGLGACCQKSVT